MHLLLRRSFIRVWLNWQSEVMQRVLSPHLVSCGQAIPLRETSYCISFEEVEVIVQPKTWRSASGQTCCGSAARDLLRM